MTKLVRDRIPDIIKSRGITPITRVASKEEYDQALFLKLAEEVQEFQESRSAEELADVLEVIHALANHNSLDLTQVDMVRRKKKEERGGFEKRIILERADGEFKHEKMQ